VNRSLAVVLEYPFLGYQPHTPVEIAIPENTAISYGGNALIVQIYHARRHQLISEQYIPVVDWFDGVSQKSIVAENKVLRFKS